MLQVTNTTPFRASIMLLPDREGVDTLFTVIKATFAIGDSLTPAEEQEPVTLVDKHYGDPAMSSVRVPSDVSLQKPGTDVLLTGSAWAPGGTPTWQTDVSVTVGPLMKTVRVFGDRVWQAGAAGAVMTWVAPFERMPLVWERAFGGSDQTEKGPTAEWRNPVGAGFRAPNGAKPLSGLPLPNLEDPAAPISSWKDAPAPAGFGPVAAHWLPRRTYAGTYDKTWEQSRAPYLPHDFDPHFCQVAPVGLVTPQHLRGGELVDLRGVNASGTLRFLLPEVRLSATYRLDSQAERRPGTLDTVIIEPDARRIVMVWRAALACDKKALKVKEVKVALDEG
jgi:hypothetical protein